MTREPGIFRRREELSVTRVDDDYFVVDPATRAVFHLNPLGRALWDALARPAAPAALAALLEAAFPDTPPERIAADLEAFLAAMAEAGLIEAAAEDPAKTPGQDAGP